jgi:hypothetical protein
MGIAVLRFSDEQILKDMENVMQAVEFYIGSMKKHPGPLKRVKKSNKQVFLIFKTY